MRTSWPCSRRKAASLPAEEPESPQWSFSKAQTRWRDGSQSFQTPRQRLAREERPHPGMANPTINERKYCQRMLTRSVCCWPSHQPILQCATHCRWGLLTNMSKRIAPTTDWPFALSNQIGAHFWTKWSLPWLKHYCSLSNRSLKESEKSVESKVRSHYIFTESWRL